MDELALGAPDIGLERDRRIKAPAASRARPDEARDRLGPVDPRRRAPLQPLVAPPGLTLFLHARETRVDLYQQIAFDHLTDGTLWAIAPPIGPNNADNRPE